jgi:hypothetical protein
MPGRLVASLADHDKRFCIESVIHRLHSLNGEHGPLSNACAVPLGSPSSTFRRLSEGGKGPREVRPLACKVGGMGAPTSGPVYTVGRLC